MNSICAAKTAQIQNRNITMDTKALRQKILDLAIHGKLIPQPPTMSQYQFCSNESR